jgi:hypothetical protein
MTDARMIRPRNTMLERIGGRPGATGKIDDGAMQRAEARIAEMAATYLDRAIVELDKLTALIKDAAANPERRAEATSGINLIAHEIRGEGSTYGYPLLTKFAASLFKFTDGATNPTDRQLALIRAHAEAMSVVARHAIKGDGGPLGAQIDQTLAMAIEKYAAQ